MGDDSSEHFLLTIDPTSDTDAQELEELTQRLLTELEPIPGLDVARVRTGPAPSGSKGDAFSLGQLAITLVQSGGVLVTAIGVIRTWLTQQNANSLELKFGNHSLKLKGKWSEDQQRIVEEWIKLIEKNSKGESKKVDGKRGASAETK